MRQRPTKQQNTERLGPSGTSPLGGGLRIRTKPFQLVDAPTPSPGFSLERFTTKSRIRRFEDLELEIIPDPSKTLGETAQHAFIEVFRLAAENTPFRPGKHLPWHLEQASSLIILRKDGIPAGFSIASNVDIEDKHFLIFNATVYAPDIRGARRAMRVNLLHFWRTALKRWPRRFYAVARTQNPLIFSTLTSATHFFPRLEESFPAHVQEAARLISHTLNPNGDFDAGALVQRGGLARDDVDPERQRHKDEQINAFCDAHLNYSRGDTFLMIAELGLWDVWRMQRKVMAKAPRSHRDKRSSSSL